MANVGLGIAPEGNPVYFDEIFKKFEFRSFPDLASCQTLNV
jgi:hypothetical protein